MENILKPATFCKIYKFDGKLWSPENTIVDKYSNIIRINYGMVSATSNPFKKVNTQLEESKLLEWY